MKTSIDKTVADMIEECIDKTSLADVLTCMADICFEKSDHVKTNWQDIGLAKTWDKDGDKLLKIALKIEN